MKNLVILFTVLPVVCFSQFKFYIGPGVKVSSIALENCAYTGIEAGMSYKGFVLGFDFYDMPYSKMISSFTKDFPYSMGSFSFTQKFKGVKIGYQFDLDNDFFTGISIKSNYCTSKYDVFPTQLDGSNCTSLEPSIILGYRFSRFVESVVNIGYCYYEGIHPKVLDYTNIYSISGDETRYANYKIQEYSSKDLSNLSIGMSLHLTY